MSRTTTQPSVNTASRVSISKTQPEVSQSFSLNRTLRVKIIDACGMTCTFCHNEGTPVVVNGLKNSRSPNPHISTARVSIYSGTNGARFLPAPVVPDEKFSSALRMLSDALDLNEIHLTGGEPTLHPQLPDIIGTGVAAGLRVGMTSNGERGAAVLEPCVQAGLDRVNFSVFGTTPAELAQVQHSRFANVRRAQRKIDALKESIAEAERAGLRANANIVVPNHGHASRVRRLLDQYSPWLSIRLLNSLDDGIESVTAIRDILEDLGAVETANHITAGVSGSKAAYTLRDGRVVWFKQIRRVRLPDTCSGCPFNNDTDCKEGFYGIRLYRDTTGNYQVGVCIQRMDLCMPVEEFVRHDLCREVMAFRDADYFRLTKDK